MYCQIILQMLCRPASTPKMDSIRNGYNVHIQDYRAGSTHEAKSTYHGRKSHSNKWDRGLHESFESYDKCYRRHRNMGKEGKKLSLLNFLIRHSP